jgi:hypothetical protein
LSTIFKCKRRYPAGASDPEIARAAVAAIKSALPLCCEQLRALVREGSVTLEGIVDWNGQRDIAEEAIRNLKGVVCVVNLIALAPSAPPSAETGLPDGVRRQRSDPQV